jgi:hypothetical protein
MLNKAFRDGAMSTVQIPEWRAWNVTGRTATENFERSGRLLTTRTGKNVEKARQVIHANMKVMRLKWDV